VVKRFPSRFRCQRDALTKITELAEKYSQ